MATLTVPGGVPRYFNCSCRCFSRSINFAWGSFMSPSAHGLHDELEQGVLGPSALRELLEVHQCRVGLLDGVFDLTEGPSVGDLPPAPLLVLRLRGGVRVLQSEENALDGALLHLFGAVVPRRLDRHVLHDAGDDAILLVTERSDPLCHRPVQHVCCGLLQLSHGSSSSVYGNITLVSGSLPALR